MQRSISIVRDRQGITVLALVLLIVALVVGALFLTRVITV